MDCPELESPQNGTVTQEERIYPNEAEYSCDDGFELEGEAVRMCQIDGEWTGEAPICEEIPTPTPTPTPPPTTEPPTTIATTEEGIASGILKTMGSVVSDNTRSDQVLMHTIYTHCNYVLVFAVLL